MLAATDDPRLGHPRRVFPPSFAACFLPSVVGAQLVAVAIGAALWVTHDGTWPAGTYLILAFSAGIGGGVNGYQIWRRSAPTVGPNGIVARGFDGRRRFAAWPAVHTGAVSTVLGMAWLRLDVGGVPARLWVPLGLSDPDGFADAVREYAGDGHPLTRAIDEWLATRTEE